MTGKLIANSSAAGTSGGTINLSGSTAASGTPAITDSGSIIANSTAGTGGTITLSATLNNSAQVNSGALISANGATGGGTVSITTQDGITLNSGAIIRANGTGVGNGGTITIADGLGGGGGGSPLPPKDPIRDAADYTLKNWLALTRFLKDADIDLDNNASERAIKDFVLMRKNALFVGSDEGGKAAAIHLSLVASAKRIGIDPVAYLTDVLGRINSMKTGDLEQLLPKRWAESQPAKTSEIIAGEAESVSEKPVAFIQPP